MNQSGPRERLVLIGGGHVHVQVLRALAMRPRPELDVTLVVDDPIAVYSGMVPGLVAHQYTPGELSIDVLPLARRAGAAVVLEAAIRVDTVDRRVCFASERSALPFERCSINIGSKVAHTRLPGVVEYAIPTRPIHALEARIEAQLGAATAERISVVVVGGGAAGVELAFAMQQRLRAGRQAFQVTLVAESGPSVGGGRRGPELVREVLSEQGIVLATGARVNEVRPDSVVLEDGSVLAAQLVLWATGAASHALGRRSGLPVDDLGFIRTHPTLEVVDHPGIFAAGDCAVLADGPVLPRSGVYAVRSGPVLVHNLLEATGSNPLRAFRPQKATLALLNTCDGSAIGTWGTWAARGDWLWRLKNWIDVRFVQRFQVLDDEGNPLPAFEAAMPQTSEEMECGGCAAKLADAPLRAALAALPPPLLDPDVVAGVDASDDVAVLRHGGALLVQTVDAFPAFTSDPWLVGRVATVNALNDVFAKGAVPRFALAIVEVPKAHGASVLQQTLAGVRHELDHANVSLVGGHTTVGTGLKVGLSVTGVPRGSDRIWPTRGARPGDVLLLSSPLGTGVLLHADMAGRAKGRWVEVLHRHLTQSNQESVLAFQGLEVHAATDVTGFGLARHLASMLRDDAVVGVLRMSMLPLLPGVGELLRAGERSTFHEQNRMSPDSLEIAPPLRRDPVTEVVFDPQTAGGLLVALDPNDASEALSRLHASGHKNAALVGVVESGERPCQVRIRP